MKQPPVEPVNSISQSKGAAVGWRTAPSTRATLATTLIGLSPVLAGYIFYNRWLALFPQIEFRNWMWSETGLNAYLAGVFSHQGAFSRSSPFVGDSVTRALCGSSIRCINAPGFWTILLTSYLLYWLIVRLNGSRTGAAVAATLWVFSLPVLDAFAWQATFGDRLAALFGLATIHAAITAMRWVGRRPTAPRVLLANALVLLPAIVAYNCKEISWLILPSLVILAIALVDEPGIRRVGRHLSVLIAASLYAFFRMIDTFVLISESPSANSLDFGGDPVHNAKLYLAFLSNHVYFTTIPHLLALATLALVLVAVVRYRSASRQARAQTRVMLWAMLSLLGGLVLCLFTPYPGPYLLMLPSLFLWVALASLWRSLFFTNGLLRSGAGLTLASACAALMLVGLHGSYSLYGDTLSWSRNFRKSLPLIAQRVPIGASTDFVIGGAPFLAYRFVGDDGERYIDQFVYDIPRPLPAAEAKMSNVPAVATSFSGYSVVLGSELSVTEILHGSQVIYSQPQSGP